MNQYQIKLGHIDARDSTGLGDILTAAFTCAYLREKDPKMVYMLWGWCNQSSIGNGVYGDRKNTYKIPYR
jgi:sugar/nucleoside kinase (ribokinase family)